MKPIVHVLVGRCITDGDALDLILPVVMRDLAGFMIVIVPARIPATTFTAVGAE